MRASGAFGTFLIAVTSGGMRLEGFIEALLGTAQTTAMIFLILLGAAIFNAFLGFSQLAHLGRGLLRELRLVPIHDPVRA